MEDRYWAVCRTIAGRVHIVRPEIEKTGHGTFLPTYARVWASGGKLSAKERALFPGYVFFQTNGKDWGAIKCAAEAKGEALVVLLNGGAPSRVRDSDMFRIVVAHATGAHNERDLQGITGGDPARRKVRRRRPRPGKSLRGEARAA